MIVSGTRRWGIIDGLTAACFVGFTSTVAICGNADWSAPPRFDGAGYAVLARALCSGDGYRAIDHPDRPRHVHFPPGYPAALALTWTFTGVSAHAAHVLSVLCTLGATLAAWWWFRWLLSGPTALILALALSANWLWARTGSAIQSEPLYLLLGQLTILAAVPKWPHRMFGVQASCLPSPQAGNLHQNHPPRSAAPAGGRRPRALGKTIGLGILLAGCLLTRQAAIGLALAVLVDRALRHDWWEALTIAAVATVLVFPWLGWMALAGSIGQTQAGLLLASDQSWLERIGGQAIFYAQRLPDQIVSPIVEVATLGHSTSAALVANFWAGLATLVLGAGWVRVLGQPRRRLAGLIPLFALAILLLWPYREAGRFLIPLIPCVLLGALEGVTALAGRLARRSGTRVRRSRLRLAAAGLILAVSLPYSCYRLAAGRSRAHQSDQRDFDLACTWIATQADRAGPVLSRHPGEVFWQTGRQGIEVPTAERPGVLDADSETIDRTIESYKVAYLLIDQERYLRAPTSPLARYVAAHPERVTQAWSSGSGPRAVAIYEVMPRSGVVQGLRPDGSSP
jgi:hypothetical protein